jgi:hypothetical protein
MKKIIILTLLLGVFQTSKALVIQQITVSSINTTEINIHTIVGEGHGFEYYSHVYEILNNTISLNICYSFYLNSAITTRENDFVIPILNNNLNNYTLIVNVNYKTLVGTTFVCNASTNASQIKTLPFSTPLSSPVSLQSTGFNSKNFTVYPNPTQGLIAVSNDINYETIEVVNHLGQLVKRFDRNKSGNYDLNNITNGLYYLVYYNATNEKVGTTKLIKSN